MAQIFENWGQNQTSKPKNFYEPADEADVQKIVREVRERGERLRVIGANHSWSAVGTSDHNLMRIDALDDLLHVDIDAMQVTVGAGIRLHALVRRLAKLGWAMQNLGSIDEQSVAGVMSTGTHGTGLGIGNIATQIVGMKIVDGKGDLYVVEDGTDLMRAARVSVGMLGIITEVTIQCVPAFRLHERSWSLPFEKALKVMPTLVKNHTHVKFWWLPHTGMIQVYVFEPTDRPATRLRLGAKSLDDFTNRYVFSGIIGLGNAAPAIVPLLNKVVARSYFKKYERVADSVDIFTVAMPPRHLESEYAVPFENTVPLVRGVKSLIDGHNLKVSFVNEVRFVAGDDSWLSPAHSGPVCQFGAYISDGPYAKPFFDGFDALAADLGARPHWGKLFGMTPESVRAAFPKYDDFQSLRATMDPDRVFSNAFTETYFP